MGRLNKHTGLVTITAGGNNLRVDDLVRYCGAAIVDPLAVPLCQATTDFAADEISFGSLFRDVVSLIHSVRAAAPNARIVVTGYPYLYDPAGINPAGPSAPLMYQSTTLVGGLNAVIENAAKLTGAQYVDVTGAFAGHGIGSAEPWINGNTSGPGSFHPNAAGYKAYYSALQGAGVY